MTCLFVDQDGSIRLDELPRGMVDAPIFRRPIPQPCSVVYQPDDLSARITVDVEEFRNAWRLFACPLPVFYRADRYDVREHFDRVLVTPREWREHGDVIRIDARRRISSRLPLNVVHLGQTYRVDPVVGEGVLQLTTVIAVAIPRE